MTIRKRIELINKSALDIKLKEIILEELRGYDDLDEGIDISDIVHDISCDIEQYITNEIESLDV